MITEIQQILTLLSTGGLPAILLIIALTGWKRMWIFGWAYDDAIKDRDKWKDTSEKLLIQLDGARAEAEKSVEWAIRIAKDSK